ncbi:ATPase family associated with various cellular activities (AAA) [Salinimicrobium sediminis]|uniref:ATPase family associated with various cellular activities (AAA) n=1 Tax=Salinimicrobium sediminis TaxID=1343891 RepID=A0A285X8D3_9FLAO|nr:AAA family ATPase [Salinimicrobium sediminis]SOC81607.1 ATPase family associated with various cellular activities (AAA) [Salinimicrobium sediminis]
MNYGNNTEPQFLPDFNLQHVNHMMNFYHVQKMYLGYFGKVPSYYRFYNRDIESFHLKFPEEFGSCILARHFNRDYDQKEEKADIIYVLKQQIIVEQEPDEVSVYFQDENSELLLQLLEFIKAFKKEKPDKASINLIIMQPHGLDNKKIDFAKPDLDLSRSYNDDFKVFHHKMLKILQEENKSGLHLLYGKPGTGKSTYIRHLCGLVKKEIVFLPGQMAQNLDNIAMTRYLMDNANCILVIEDAEELIVSRDQQRNSNLAMILNITDGILGESLGIQIIATFNTDVQNIDPALKRKGRLKSAYEFKSLSPEKANALLREQQTDYYTNNEMTLAEIYNISEEEQYKSPTRKAVGFR